jgi:hypothetical protein
VASRMAGEASAASDIATATTVAMVTTVVMGGPASTGAWDPMPKAAAVKGCKPGPVPFWT